MIPNHDKQHKPTGQVMIIFVLALVGLLSFTALAVDLGTTWNDRRYDQNVADSAALAGGQTVMTSVQSLKPSEFDCDTGGQYVSTLGDSNWIEKPAWLTEAKLNAILAEAIDSAAANRKTDLVQGLDTQNGAAVACGVDAGNKPYFDVKVLVSGETGTSFAHVFSRTLIRNTVEAVARIRPRIPFLVGVGIYALDDGCTEGINIRGGGSANPNVQIDNGGAFSRSCIDNTGHGSMTADVSISCLEDAAHPNWCDPSNTDFTPRMQTVSEDPYEGEIPLPDCNDRTIAPERTITGNTLEPGYYPGGFPGHSNLNLKPGLYCIPGDVKLNGGGSITSIDDGGLHGVTVIFMDGGLDLTGNGFMDLAAAVPGEASVPPNVVPGLVIAFAEGNNSAYNSRGNSQTKLVGTVYAPESEIILGGTGDVVTATQFIGYMFKYHGTETEHIVYNGDLFAQIPPNLSLFK